MPGVLKGARIGLRAILVVAWYRYAARLPEKVVVDAIRDLHGLTISSGQLQNILDQLSEAHTEYHTRLLTDLKARGMLNIDQTS